MEDKTLKQTFTEYDKLSKKELDECSKQNFVYYKQRETVYIDPSYKNQIFSLFSFLPSSGATPDDNGVYGMIKCRGTFETEDEMNTRAEFLVNNCDSFHRIYHVNTGRPVPLTLNEEFTKEIKYAKQNENDEDIIHTSVKKDKEEQTKIQSELNTRVKEIREEEQNPAPIEPLDDYIQSKVKIAFNMDAIDNFRKQLEKAQSVIKTQQEKIEELDKTNPEFNEQFLTKYNESRKSVGVDIKDTTFNSILYMNYKKEDLDKYL